jgi:hypothetical protein
VNDAPDPDFFATLQSFRCTVTVDRGAIVLWHSTCGENLERELPVGVGLGLLFAHARAHECGARDS